MTGDVAAIEAVISDYIEGWYQGDGERMDRALHTDLVKRTLDDKDQLRFVGKGRMMELTAAGGGEMSDPEYQVSVDDISATIASARVISPEYIDYLQLVRVGDGWRIANVLFRYRS